MSERMQISRHWRMKANRYRLEGFHYEDGSVSLQNVKPRHGHEEFYDLAEPFQPKIVYLAPAAPPQNSAAD